MKNTKLNNQYTINVNDDIKELIEKIASYYQRKPADLLRLLLVPVIINEYAKIQKIAHPENSDAMTIAIFKQ
ncbi:MAG: hypothetical protein IKA31_02460 [Clostridia bacterium]|nr:hypothetical protein [Clostridia bacterium]MBR3889378.1 hypothetical protein [bacterium]